MAKDDAAGAKHVGEICRNRTAVERGDVFLELGWGRRRLHKQRRGRSRLLALALRRVGELQVLKFKSELAIAFILVFGDDIGLPASGAAIRTCVHRLSILRAKPG